MVHTASDTDRTWSAFSLPANEKIFGGDERHSWALTVAEGGRPSNHRGRIAAMSSIVFVNSCRNLPRLPPETKNGFQASTVERRAGLRSCGPA